MTIRLDLACAMIALCLVPGVSAAQTAPASDLVVMRKVIAAPNLRNGVWDLYDLVVQPSCSETAPARYTVTCRSPSGNAVDDGRCKAARPDGMTTAPDYSACTYRWDVPEYPSYSTTCGMAAERTRNVRCERGTTPAGFVDNSVCTRELGYTPESRDPATKVVSGCSDLLRNGGFESDGANWTGIYTILKAPANKAQIRTGERSLFLTSQGGGANAAQVINTTPGWKYRIEYHAMYSAGNPNSYFYNSARDLATGKYIVNVRGTIGNAVFKPNAMEFTAVGAQTEIKFHLAISGGSYYTYIDDVTLTVVP